MTTIQLMELIVSSRNKREISKLLNANRIPIEKSKYC